MKRYMSQQMRFNPIPIEKYHFAKGDNLTFLPDYKIS